MKSGSEGTRPNNGIDRIIEFIRENALAREIGGMPVITSKGKQYLDFLRTNAPISKSEGTRIDEESSTLS